MTTIGYATLAIIPSLKGVSAEINKQLAAMPEVGTAAGKRLGDGIASGALGAGPGKKIGKELEAGVADGAEGAAGQVKSRLSERLGAQVGSAVGKSIGAGIKVGIAGGALAASTAVAGIGVALKKGFDRLESIDTATFKLKALGHSGDETKQIMDNALASVKGTAFGLQDAATAAASAVAAGIKPGQDLTRYLGEVGDAAAVAGTNFEDMGSIFNKIQTQNKAYTDDLQQLSDRGLPIFTWLQQEYGVTGDKLSEMVQKGEVDSAHFQEAIEKNIGGAAQKMGQSFDGAVDNLEASVARLGANFITAALGGDPANALQGPTAAIGALTDKFDGIGAWVNAHSGEIHGFFVDIKNVALEVGGAIKDIGTWLVENKGAAETLAAVFVGWKVLSVVNDVVGSLKGMSTLLRVTLPADAAAGATAMEGSIGGIVSAMGPLLAIPGFLAFADSRLKDAAPSAENARARGAEALANRGGALAGSGKDPAQRPDAPYVPTPARSGSLDGPHGPFGGGAAYAPPTSGGYQIPGQKKLFGDGYGTGGPISGPGTGISDSILAWVSNGEFVVNADATRKNMPLLQIINSGKLPGFAGGGAVSPDVDAAQALVGTPYSMAKRFDCSGDVARVINAALGISGGSLMTTANAQQWLSALGFKPGIGGPGTISVGWKNGGPGGGHMAMTLSDGRNAEGGGSHPNFMIGGAAAGASSPQFTNHMFLAIAKASGQGDQTQANVAAPDTAAASDSGTVSGEGSGGSGPLPTSISGLATWPFDAMTAAGQADSGPGHRDPMAYFPNAASAAIGGQISSALGVAGINGTPPILQAASTLLGGISAKDHATGKTLFDGSNLFGGQGRSAAPLAATSTATGTSLPDAVHTGTGQAPGPQVVNNVSFHARDAEGALDQWRRLMDQRVAAKLSVY